VSAAAVPQTVVVGYRQLMSGAAVDRTPGLHFQRRHGIEIAHSDAERLGVATGDQIQVTQDGRTQTGPALVQRGLRPGVVRLPARVPHVGPGSVAAAPAEGASA
jgi:anaerobic selenocysteine-containing dehydrogenase